MTNELSPEQQAAIPLYCQEWNKKTISTEAIDRDRAKQVLEQSYLTMGKEIPEFLFCESPFSACQTILEKLESKELESQQLQWNLLEELGEFLPDTEIYYKSNKHIFRSILKCLHPRQQLSSSLREKLNVKKIHCAPLSKAIGSNFTLHYDASIVNFFNSTSQSYRNIERWPIIQSILTSCDYIFAFESFCIICDRPTEVNLDNNGLLHAEGKPVILFPDGYSLYSYHGITLPEQYGKLHPHQWSIKFFLKEQDFARQEVLARGLDIVINRLTSEQENLLDVYLEKWYNIDKLIQPLSHFEIEKDIEKIYGFLDLKTPNIIFCNSPLQLFEFSKKLSLSRKKPLEIDIPCHALFSKILIQMKKSIGNKLIKVFHPHLMINRQTVMDFSIAELEQIDEYLKDRKIFDRNLCWSRGNYAVIDYCINVLDCICDRETADIFLAIAPYFEQIFPTEEVCLVCDRPRSISLDSNHIIHAEGKPAIEYADGFSVYVHHGTRIPEKYGKLPPSQWRSQWLLSEKNAEVRRVLIQNIGYAKMCRELQARELDSWQDYSLLGIDFESEESIHLLKMTCPSTEDIHVLRVPPSIYSAREAIAWVNWGIDPEAFSIQT